MTRFENGEGRGLSGIWIQGLSRIWWAAVPKRKAMVTEGGGGGAEGGVGGAMH
jgi:hypothetical protein